MGWRAAAVALAALVFAVLPADRIRLGAAQLQGLVGSYSYAEPVPLPDVEGLAVEDVYRPGTVRLVWTNPDMTGGASNFHYQVRRVDPTSGGEIHLTDTWHNYWVENADFSTTTVFEFWVRLVPDDGSGSGLPAPPPGADPEDILQYPVPGRWAKLRVHVEEQIADENQTVDSRYDLRYGNPTFLDFRFGNRTYRGGLYAGFANDPSRVGRSFLKFQVPAGVQDALYYTGSVNAFSPRRLQSGSVEIGCAKVTDTSWSAATLKWSTAPTFDPSSATYRFTVDDDDQWAHWTLGSDILSAQGATDPLCVGLGSTNENASGQWVYFAKKEYDLAPGPRLVLAAHYPGTVPAPAGLQVTAVGATTVDLTWTATLDYGTFVVQQRTGGGSWTNAQVSWSGSTAAQAQNLQPGTAYEFRVQNDTGTHGYGTFNSLRVTATTTGP